MREAQEHEAVFLPSSLVTYAYVRKCGDLEENRVAFPSLCPDLKNNPQIGSNYREPLAVWIAASWETWVLSNAPIPQSGKMANLLILHESEMYEATLNVGHLQKVDSATAEALETHLQVYTVLSNTWSTGLRDAIRANRTQVPMLSARRIVAKPTISRTTPEERKTPSQNLAADKAAKPPASVSHVCCPGLKQQARTPESPPITPHLSNLRSITADRARRGVKRFGFSPPLQSDPLVLSSPEETVGCEELSGVQLNLEGSVKHLNVVFCKTQKTPAPPVVVAREVSLHPIALKQGLEALFTLGFKGFMLSQTALGRAVDILQNVAVTVNQLWSDYVALADEKKNREDACCETFVALLNEKKKRIRQLEQELRRSQSPTDSECFFNGKRQHIEGSVPATDANELLVKTEEEIKPSAHTSAKTPPLSSDTSSDGSGYTYREKVTTCSANPSHSQQPLASSSKAEQMEDAWSFLSPDDEG